MLCTFGYGKSKAVTVMILAATFIEKFPFKIKYENGGDTKVCTFLN
jgi:hypothetical protein